MAAATASGRSTVLAGNAEMSNNGIEDVTIKGLRKRTKEARATILIFSLMGSVLMRQGKDEPIDPQQVFAMGFFAGVALATLDSGVVNDIVKLAAGEMQTAELYKNATKSLELFRRAMA